MRVFKFGGASVRDAKSVQNVHRIIEQFNTEPLIIVVSAMGKITNKFEGLVKAHFEKSLTSEILEDVRNYHGEIVKELFWR
jgi:aspartate kinase